MKHCRIGWLRGSMVVVLLLAASLGTIVSCPGHAAEASNDEKVRLVVLVVFDQLRGDYIGRWREWLSAGGFRRLEQEGTWFRNCHYPYAVTKTAAGHASLLTGSAPRTHGIIANEWFDRATGKYAYCVSSQRYEQFPPSFGKRADESRLDDARGVSPERLLVPTVGDVLKQVSDGKSRVVSLSFKDRSAVLPAGKQPDACYWFDPLTGQFVTSTCYRQKLHPWVAEFNRSRFADRWQGKEWSPFYPKLDYRKLCGALTSRGEDVDGNFSHELPPGGEGPAGISYYKALYVSPFGNEVILELAKRAIDAEQLGKDDQPDLLCVSFSCNDPIGHLWGPDSQEVLDVTLRSDRVIKDLLDHLDAQIGKGKYLLALTADHGICPLPEESRARGIEAMRVPPSLLSTDAEDFLRLTFGRQGDLARWIEARSEPWVYLNQALLKERGLKQAEVEAALARWYSKQPGILKAYTRTQLLGDLPDDDLIGQSLLRSFHPQRSGDVAVILKPYHLFSSPLSVGTNHGTPHTYDTHVPLFVIGSGMAPGTSGKRVTPQVITPIFARALGIEPPSGNEATYPTR